jgi:hypothetical protein
MKHELPNNVKQLLEEQDNLGFDHVREAAEYVLANPDWYIQLKGVKYKDYERLCINTWRSDMIANEIIRCTNKPVPPCSSINYWSSASFGGKVSKQGGDD